MRVVYIAVEGQTDIPVAEQIIRFVGLEPRRAIVAGGKSKLGSRIVEMFRSGAHMNWLILRDLDYDAPCAPGLLRRLSVSS